MKKMSFGVIDVSAVQFYQEWTRKLWSRAFFSQILVHFIPEPCFVGNRTIPSFRRRALLTNKRKISRSLNRRRRISPHNFDESNLNSKVEMSSTSAYATASADSYFDPEDTNLITTAKRELKFQKPFVYTYTERDVALYNMGIGASAEELHWIFDGDDEFAAIPTIGAVPAIPACGSLEAYYLPNFDPVRAERLRYGAFNQKIHREEYCMRSNFSPSSVPFRPAGHGSIARRTRPRSSFLLTPGQ